MSFIVSSFRSLYNKFPSLNPSSIYNATASTATSAGHITRDAFSKTLGNASSTAFAHPYVATAFGLSIGYAAYRYLFNSRRSIGQAAVRELRQHTASRASGNSAKTAAHDRTALKPAEEIKIPKVKNGAITQGAPNFISDLMSEKENWIEVCNTIRTNPKSIEHVWISQGPKLTAVYLYPGCKYVMIDTKIFQKTNNIPIKISNESSTKQKNELLTKLLQTKIPDDMKIDCTGDLNPESGSI